MSPLRVLVVDNSIFYRLELADKLLEHLPKGSLMETASDPIHAKEKRMVFRPNVIVVNFMLAAFKMEGKSYLPQLVQNSNVPVIVFGNVEVGRGPALRDGAADYLVKPTEPGQMDIFYRVFAKAIETVGKKSRRAVEAAPSAEQSPVSAPQNKVVARGTWSPKSAPAADKPIGHTASRLPERPKVTDLHMPPSSHAVQKTSLSRMPQPSPQQHIKLIAIGSSTGGTEALSTVLKDLNPPLPGIVIVQHIPPMFSKLFAARLDEECKLHVKEAEDGDIVKPNCVYIAPGSFHMTISRNGGAMKLTCKTGPRVHGCCPSVDVLFKTVAEQIGDEALGVILTGMGRDGADGLLMMKQKGSPTLGQDKDSSVVYGMPRAAWEAGAVDQQFPLQDMASAITRKARD